MLVHRTKVRSVTAKLTKQSMLVHRTTVRLVLAKLTTQSMLLHRQQSVGYSYADYAVNACTQNSRVGYSYADYAVNACKQNNSQVGLHLRKDHCRNPQDFYPLHFFHERSVKDRNPGGSDDEVVYMLIFMLIGT